MPIIKAVYIFFLLIFSSIAIAQAADERDLIIQPESSYQQHMQIVNQQMDQVQGKIPQQTAIKNVRIQQKKPEWVYNISPEVSSISYHEPSLKVREKGVMSGINGSYTYRPNEGNILNLETSDMYRLEGNFSYGHVTYNGSNIFKGIRDYLFEIRGLIGKDFNFNNQSTLLTPYVGGGYRSLFDTLSQDKPGGYNRKIQYLYIPAGAEVMSQINDGWSIGADAEYDFFIHGKVTSYLGGLGYGKLINTQKHGFGLRGSIKLIKKWNRFNLILEPFIRYWHIHNSEVNVSKPFNIGGTEFVIIGYEPDNNSTQIGGRLGIEF